MPDLRNLLQDDETPIKIQNFYQSEDAKRFIQKLSMYKSSPELSLVLADVDCEEDEFTLISDCITEWGIKTSTALDKYSLVLWVLRKANCKCMYPFLI